MTSEIKLTYIDDKLDTLLVEYLYTLSEEEQNFEYDEYKFNSGEDSYQSLLENDSIASSDIIIVDSKLFENEFANSKAKFTGQELKIIFATANPFIQIIVITQNNEIDTSIKKVEEVRRIAQLLSENSASYEKTLVVEKVNNLINKVPSYKELTDEKINELINLVKNDIEENND